MATSSFQKQKSKIQQGFEFFFLFRVQRFYFHQEGGSVRSTTVLLRSGDIVLNTPADCGGIIAFVNPKVSPCGPDFVPKCFEHIDQNLSQNLTLKDNVSPSIRNSQIR